MIAAVWEQPLPLFFIKGWRPFDANRRGLQQIDFPSYFQHFPLFFTHKTSTSDSVMRRI
jgi:hypothetical protein